MGNELKKDLLNSVRNFLKMKANSLRGEIEEVESAMEASAISSSTSISLINRTHELADYCDLFAELPERDLIQEIKKILM